MGSDPLKEQMALFEVSKPEVQEEKKEKPKTPLRKPRVEKSAKESPGKTAAAAPKKAGGKTGTKPARGLSGLVPDGDVRLTANIREDLHLKLKIAAAQQRTTIGEIIEALVEKYVK
jgi:hypothetical protein